jgi:glycosyltransferase involved in cell wall biosynthesis
LKILIDARELVQNRITGIGRFLLNFLNYALKNRPDWSFILLGNQHTSCSIYSDNLKIVILREKYRLFWDQIQSLAIIKKENPDIYFSPYYKLPLLSPAKTIATVHDLIEFILPEYRRNIFYRWMFRLCLMKANRVITVSESSKKDVCRVMGIEPRKIIVSYNSVRPNFKRCVDKKAVLKRYGIQKEYILYLGNFNRHKNLSVLIRAYDRLDSNLKERVDLVVAGDRPELLAGAAGCRGLVIPGHIDEKDLPVIYEEAKLFVFPSLYEGFGLPPLEAMSYGVPVIASNRPAMKEILEDAVEYFEPQDDEALALLMKKFLTSKENRKRLFQTGIDQVNKYDFKHNIEIILNTMETVATS